MKVSELINQINKVARKEPCAQLDSILKWIRLNTPDRSEYDRKRYIKLKRKS